jgi:hypothetical protein
MKLEVLLGKTTEHLVPIEGTKCLIHQHMLQDFLRLQQDAQAEGLDLQIISAFRDHERQSLIWNKKARGERALFDDQGKELTFSSLSAKEIMWSILRWSAVPGCSRHHWGTDIDIFDAHTQRAEEVKLVPQECVGQGPAAALHGWLDSLMSQKSAYGFYRPYRTDRGGVAPERWHLSYHPVSSVIQEKYSFSIFQNNIKDSNLLLKEELLDHADEIYQRFFLNIDTP